MSLLVVSGVFACVFILLTLVKSYVVFQQKKIVKEFEGRNIVKICRNANYFGQESLGMAQVRGNGALILLENSLIFKMWLPEKTMEIPLHVMNECSIVTSHLGKSKFAPLLKVVFMNDNGFQDSAAWLIEDPQSWIDTIERLKRV